MTITTIFRNIFSLSLLLTFFLNARAQDIDEKTYLRKMQLMGSLSFYRMNDYDKLYRISLSYNLRGNEFDNVCYGWILEQNEKHIVLLRTDGVETEINKKQATAIDRLLVKDTTIAIFLKKRNGNFSIHPFGDNYLLSLWLYKKGKFEYSKKVLPENDQYHDDAHIRDDFGIVYFDAMLCAFSQKRNYRQAINFGIHLSGNSFNGYEYQQQAISLKLQLKTDTGDFKSFRLPDSLEWATLKNKLNRTEQILYLADRLRLLNCIQPGQPGGISYDMPQFSIPFSQAAKLNIQYWNENRKYGVVNPFTELFKMNLKLREIELLLPYLLSDTYIVSYSYFRDFRPERTLHKSSWVVHDLIFEMTNNVFFYQRAFDSLSYDQKKMEVEKIRSWCEENSTLSKEELVIKTLRTTNDWNEFKKALQTAKNEKYGGLLPAIIPRYYDFRDFYWPVNKDLITETMYEFGDKRYLQTVKGWSLDTNRMNGDRGLEAKFYTTLFLLKNDPASYDNAMTTLESILKKDDGEFFYPRAMDLLLSRLNDRRVFKLAQGILDKPDLSNFIDVDYYVNFVKKLLALKDDHTFNFINEKLPSFTPQEMANFNKGKGYDNAWTQSDFYVLVVDKLKGGQEVYDPESDFKTRLEYRKALSKWFAAQYLLLKNNKPNALHLDITKVIAPVAFVDAPQ